MPTLQVRKICNSCRELRVEAEHLSGRFRVRELTVPAAPPASGSQPVVFTVLPPEAGDDLAAAGSANLLEAQITQLRAAQVPVVDIVACIQDFCRNSHRAAVSCTDGDDDGASSVAAPLLTMSTRELANAVAPDTELVVLSNEQARTQSEPGRDSESPEQSALEGGVVLQQRERHRDTERDRETERQQLRQENTDLRLQVQALEQEVLTLSEELEEAEETTLEAEAAAERCAGLSLSLSL